MLLLRTVVRLVVMVAALVAAGYYTPLEAQGDCRLRCKTQREPDCISRECTSGGHRYRGTLQKKGECCIRDCPESAFNNRCMDHSYYVGCCGSRLD